MVLQRASSGARGPAGASRTKSDTSPLALRGVKARALRGNQISPDCRGPFRIKQSPIPNGPRLEAPTSDDHERSAGPAFSPEETAFLTARGFSATDIPIQKTEKALSGFPCVVVTRLSQQLVAISRGQTAAFSLRRNTAVLHLAGRFPKEPCTMSRKQTSTTPRNRAKTYRTPPHPMAWAMSVTSNNVHHVYPINDLRRHSTRNCWCRPVDDEGVVVHSSLDGREFYETGERMLS